MKNWKQYVKPMVFSILLNILILYVYSIYVFQPIQELSHEIAAAICRRTDCGHDSH